MKNKKKRRNRENIAGKGRKKEKKRGNRFYTRNENSKVGTGISEDEQKRGNTFYVRNEDNKAGQGLPEEKEDKFKRHVIKEVKEKTFVSSNDDDDKLSENMNLKKIRSKFQIDKNRKSADLERDPSINDNSTCILYDLPNHLIKKEVYNSRTNAKGILYSCKSIHQSVDALFFQVKNIHYLNPEGHPIKSRDGKIIGTTDFEPDSTWRPGRDRHLFIIDKDGIIDKEATADMNEFYFDLKRQLKI